ncbi:hypothetical protein A4A49_29287 [Nicotiana attenuata]|uniref:Uncharacterized protein n=1 Tax=Nicotiana attenuata TaxID=49451 RepID=A0A1J6KA61_NICAT|nr:hypothetical protein A4A49_29287 [Nicotiana attenuata]
MAVFVAGFVADSAVFFGLSEQIFMVVQWNFRAIFGWLSWLNNCWFWSVEGRSENGCYGVVFEEEERLEKGGGGPRSAALQPLCYRCQLV